MLEALLLVSGLMVGYCVGVLSMYRRLNRQMDLTDEAITYAKKAAEIAADALGEPRPEWKF